MWLCFVSKTSAKKGSYNIYGLKFNYLRFNSNCVVYNSVNNVSSFEVYYKMLYLLLKVLVCLFILSRLVFVSFVIYDILRSYSLFFI